MCSSFAAIYPAVKDDDRESSGEAMLASYQEQLLLSLKGRLTQIGAAAATDWSG